MKRLFGIAAISLIGFCQSVQAVNYSGPYLGGGIAATNVLNSSCANLGGFSCSGYSPSDAPTSGTPFNLVAGYDFNKHLGLEIGFAQLGTYTIQGVSGVTAGSYKASATTFALRVGGGSARGLSVFGKIGLARVNTKYMPLPSWLFSGSTNRSGNGLIGGVGMQYNFNNTFGFRLSMDIIDYSDTIFSNIMRDVSLMAVFRL